MFKRNENSTLEEFLSKAKKGFAQAGLFMILTLVLTGGLTLVLQHQVWSLTQPGHVSMERFDTCSGIIDAFNKSSNYGGLYMDFGNGLAVPMAAESQAVGSGGFKAGDFSTTNIQVEGVDEADIVKTDGEYIYAISGRKLVIIRAWPAGDAEVLSETNLEEFSPSEMLIKDDIIMLFGYTREIAEYPMPDGEAVSGEYAQDIYYPYYRYMSFMTVQLWDVSDREDPEKVREVDFEGNYLTSRMIGDDVYFVINSYPRMYGEPENPVDILPVYRDTLMGTDIDDSGELVPVCGCANVGYFEPGYARSFITLASMSISDPDADIEKEVVVGSGENIYASQDNIYIAEYNHFPWWGRVVPLMEAAGTDGVFEEPTETTIVHKFSMDNGEIEYLSNAKVPGRILNQFSMDESEGYFRIATTIGRVSQMGGASTNNIYVYDSDMGLEGKLEDLAPGEQIYSARFMGDRGYLVTFKKIDPFFVIDLSDPSSPEVLGKLKIPGYSDYLHPYDENHVIGIGKDSVEAEEGGMDFSWHQGVKMALFDVSDVENPKELHKVVIGDRGTDSYALHDHKAFLFDREKELLVLPILLAEIKGDPEDVPDWLYGDYVYQGAYVYSLNPDDGFDLKGRITHYDDDEVFRKSGYYFYGDTYSVKRAGYLEDTLWTFSNNMLKLNDLDSLDEIATLDFGDSEEPKYVGMVEDNWLSGAVDLPVVNTVTEDD